LNVFFVDIDRNLPGAESASFKGKVSVSVEGAKTLFSASKSWPGVHPAFFPNFLGRGDYWAPHCHRQFSKKNALEAVGKDTTRRNDFLAMVANKDGRIL
jgi:hypothetical protein